MTGLEKNRVFDTPKLEMLRSAGSMLLDTGMAACKAWDEAVSGLKDLEGQVPSEIRSSMLSEALSGVNTPFSSTEYEIVRMKLDHTLLKLAGNMPSCDAEGAAAVTFITDITCRCSTMIKELKQYLNIETLSLDLADYENTMLAYRAGNEQEEPDLDALSEQAETILKGLPEYTSFDADPVNMETGNFVYRYTDLENGRTEPFSFTRSYNAMDRNKGVLGRGWLHNWEMQLTRQENHIVLLHEDGREEHFTRTEDAEKGTSGKEVLSTYQSCQNSRNMLFEMDGNYYLTGIERKVHIFDKQGKFLRVQREDGGGVTLTYEEDKLVLVKEDTGMTFDFTYDRKGRLINVKDGIGRSVSYAYDGKKLTEVTDPAGNSFTYAYGKNGKLLQLLDKRGVSILCNEYDDKKRITSQKFPDGGIIKMEYLNNGRVCVTERNGSKTTYTHDKKHRNTETVYEDGKETRTYDEKDRCLSYTDKNGNRTTKDYDMTGRNVCVTDALGNRTQREYDKEGRPVREVRADGGETRWCYDSQGRLTEKTDPEEHTTAFAYRAEERRPSEIILPDGGRLHLAYDKKGNILAIDYPDGTGMTYRYDILDRVVESCDKRGNTTSFSYDAMNRITAVTRADGRSRSYRYNEMGEALEIKDFDGYSAGWEYNVLNKPATYTDKCGRKTLMEYDLMWNLSRITDPEGGVTEYGYNVMNRLETVKEPGGSRVSFVYDANGNRTEIHYPDGSVRRYEYDALNRRISETDEQGNTTRTFYDCVGNISRTVDGAGNETLYVYDKNGRKIKETDGTGAVTRYTYTSLGKPETVTNPAGRITRYHYDIGGRLKKMEKGDGTWETYEYDASGNITARSYQDGRRIIYRYDCLDRVTEIRCGEVVEKSYEYDALGRVTAVTDAMGNCTRYRYTPEGALFLVTDPEGNRVSYTYNGRDELLGILRLSAGEQTPPDEDLTDISRLKALGGTFHLTLLERDKAGRIEKITGEDGKTMHYRYDVMGRVIFQKDGEGRETTFSYHPGGGIKEACYPDGKRVAFTYDSLQRLQRMQDWLGETVFAYDEAGRLTRTTDHRGESTEYGYGPDGARAWMRYPDGREVKYCFDTRGRLNEIVSGQFKTGYAYNEKGQLCVIRRGNGIESLYRYDAVGRITELVHQGKEDILEAFTYRYDVLGNCTGMSRSSTEPGCSYQRDYKYDALNRLTAVYEGEKLLRTYTYDAYGERMGEMQGSLTADVSAAPVFGCRGELKALWQEGQCLQENTYNGLGRRVGMKMGSKEEKYFQKDFLTDPTDAFGRVIMETGEKKRYYLWHDNTLLGMPEEGSYVLTDRLHTPVCVTDREGKSRSCYAYDEFGIPMYEREEIPLPFGFTGHSKEAISGLYHAGAREYDSRRGRFLTRDQYRYMDYKDSLSLNLYQYAKGNPLRYVDFDGHMCIEEPSYMERTLNHVVKGNYTDDVTGLGVGLDVTLGLLGADWPMDIRDLTADFTVNFDPSDPSWWGTMALDLMAFIPVIGAVKYADDAGTLIKNLLKNADNVADGAKYSDEMLDGISETVKAGRKKSDDLLKNAKEMLEESRKKADEVKEVGENIGKAGNNIIGGMCFVRGTLIRTKVGYKPIECIRVGDEVYSQNVNKEGEKGYKNVISLYRNNTKVLIRISVDNIIIETTENHRFYTLNKGWIAAQRLITNDKLIDGQGGTHSVQSIERMVFEEALVVYNFEVSEWHTYFVSKIAILVHNDCDIGVNKWHKGSFDSPGKSLIKHFEKHGAEVGANDVEQYLRKAEEFSRNLRGARKAYISGETPGVIRYYKNGKYIDIVDGKIISFGKQ